MIAHPDLARSGGACRLPYSGRRPYLGHRRPSTSPLTWLVALTVITAAGSAAEPIALAGRAMGTTWSVKFFQPAPSSPALDPTLVTARVTATLEHLESVFSTYRSASELSRFNTATSTDWCPVSPELARVAWESRRISETTSGAFDATVDPLVRLWGFGPQRRITLVPTASEINAARAFVGYQRLEVRLSPPALRKSIPELSADFSSLAKGFAADALSELLTALGAPDHLAQIGGDLKTSGTRPWRTAIEQPASPDLAGHTAALAPALARIISLSGRALSTSGNVHNFTTIAGQRYGHIIDPRTGHPIANALASVSVVHEACATSSALATALCVLGPDAGWALAIREHLACLFILREGSVLTHRATPEFARIATPGPAPLKSR